MAPGRGRERGHVPRKERGQCENLVQIRCTLAGHQQVVVSPHELTTVSVWARNAPVRALHRPAEWTTSSPAAYSQRTITSRPARAARRSGGRALVAGGRAVAGESGGAGALQLTPQFERLAAGTRIGGQSALFGETASDPRAGSSRCNGRRAGLRRGHRARRCLFAAGGGVALSRPAARRLSRRMGAAGARGPRALAGTRARERLPATPWRKQTGAPRSATCAVL